MNEMLTVDQYAKRYQLHPAAVRRMCERGTLNAIKLGNRWRIAAPKLAKDTQVQDQRLDGVIEALENMALVMLDTVRTLKDEQPTLKQGSP